MRGERLNDCSGFRFIMSKDTFYFSHDYNARNDIKIKRLIAKHKFAGYGIYWAIVEELYNNANALPLDYECIAFDLNIEIDLLKSIINDFDLFVIDNGFFGSLSIEKRLEQRNQKSLKARESANKRWNKYDSNANALQTQSDSNAIKESKVKENKENEIKNNNDIFYNELIISEQWLEQVAINNTAKFNLDEIKSKLLVFKNDLNIMLDIKQQKKEFTSHFVRWLNQQKKDNTKDNNGKPKMVY